MAKCCGRVALIKSFRTLPCGNPAKYVIGGFDLCCTHKRMAERWQKQGRLEIMASFWWQQGRDPGGSNG
jgi:hypothetical protein